MAPPLGARAGSSVTLAPLCAARSAPPRLRLVASGISSRGRLLPLRSLKPGRRGAPLLVRATSDPNKDRVRERVNRIEEEINRQVRTALEAATLQTTGYAATAPPMRLQLPAAAPAAAAAAAGAFVGALAPPDGATGVSPLFVLLRQHNRLRS